MARTRLNGSDVGAGRYPDVADAKPIPPTTLGFMVGGIDTAVTAHHEEIDVAGARGKSGHRRLGGRLQIADAEPVSPATSPFMESAVDAAVVADHKEVNVIRARHQCRNRCLKPAAIGDAKPILPNRKRLRRRRERAQVAVYFIPDSGNRSVGRSWACGNPVPVPIRARLTGETFNGTRRVDTHENFA